MFAHVEEAIQLTLWHYAKTHQTIARSVFSGVRVKDGMSFIKRIAEATGAPTEIQEELGNLFAQLHKITDTRNEVLHHGAQSVARGNAFVTNALLAHLPDKITLIPISPATVDEMTADLRKIIVTLHARHAGRPAPEGALERRMTENVVSSPWRYTHLVLRPESRTAAEKSPRTRRRDPKQPRQPPASRG
jgi:hypothetical protein